MSSSPYYSETIRKPPERKQSLAKSKSSSPFYFNSVRSDSLTVKTSSTLEKQSHDSYVVQPDENNIKPHRRTFQSSTKSEKQPVAVRKTKSLRESSRSKLRSPPPPPKLSKSEVIDKLPSLPVDKRIKRHPSLGEKTKSIVHHSHSHNALKIAESPDDMPSVNKAFAEYQGYSRHSRHGSFTYSPPPRTSSLTESSVPAVPPVPKLLKSRRSSSLEHKSNTARPTSDTSNISNVNFYQNGNNTSELQKELDRMLTDLPVPSMMENINQGLAEIERDIKALAIQRSSFIMQKEKEIAAATTGRKRGKTLPGNLAIPPPIPTLVLPPMKLNPLQMTIPNNLHKKSQSITMRSSTSTSNMTTKIKLSALSSIDTKTTTTTTATTTTVAAQHDLNKKLSLPILKRKSHALPKSVRPEDVAGVRRATSFKQQPSWWDGDRSPKTVPTILKYYGAYLSDYERQREIHGYQHIYFIGPHAAKQKQQQGHFDDERGDYNVLLQDHLAYRYQVIEVLGRGSFGQVVKCFDHKMNQTVAIKIIRNKKRFHAQAMTEIHILKKLKDWDPEDQSCTIKMTDNFSFRNHLCIAFECMSMNLYEFIKSNHFQGCGLGLIKRITYQILQSLLLLAEHDVIHCDLKPENIMLKQSGKSLIKVIDFGSSCFESERVYTYIQSRFYRSPEVILGISYHKSIDMWSLGCIIAELYTGVPIFPGENEQEQLSCIMEVMGLPDRHIIEKSSRKKLFFDYMGNPRIVTNSKGKKRLPCTRSLFQALKCNNDLVFLDFVERCLQWDPMKRMTPKEALQHEWFTSNSGIPVKPVLFPSASPTYTKKVYPSH